MRNDRSESSTRIFVNLLVCLLAYFLWAGPKQKAGKDSLECEFNI